MNYKVLKAVVVLLLAVSQVGYAQIDLSNDTGGNATELSEKVFDWAFDTGAERFPALTSGSSVRFYSDGFWSFNLSSPAASGAKTLRAQIQHVILPGGHDPDGSSDFTINIPGIARPAAGADTAIYYTTWWAAHDNRHFDVIKLDVGIPSTGNASISLRGTHDPTNENRWVVVEYEAEANGAVTVFGSYPGHDDQQVLGPEDIAEGERKRVTIPEIDEDEENIRPTDYRVRFDGSLSEVTSAFIAQPVQSGYGLRQIALENALSLFDEDEELRTPMLRNDSVDLYIAIDLSQWSSHAGTFNSADRYSFNQGVSNDLPGFLVGVSPVRFDSTNGFETDSLFTGMASVEGIISAKTISVADSVTNDQDRQTESSTIVLWIFVVLVALGVLIYLIFKSR